MHLAGGISHVAAAMLSGAGAGQTADIHCTITFMTVSRQGTVQSVLRPGLGSVMTLHANCSPLSRCVATRTVE